MILLLTILFDIIILFDTSICCSHTEEGARVRNVWKFLENLSHASSVYFEFYKFLFRYDLMCNASCFNSSLRTACMTAVNAIYNTTILSIRDTPQSKIRTLKCILFNGYFGGVTCKITWAQIWSAYSYGGLVSVCTIAVDGSPALCLPCSRRLVAAMRTINIVSVGILYRRKNLRKNSQMPVPPLCFSGRPLCVPLFSEMFS